MADKPDCDICGQPYHRHMEICGMGRVCPASGFTYRAKRPEAADEITRLNTENEELRRNEIITADSRAHYAHRAEKAEALVDEMREGLKEANEAIGVCIDGFEKSNPTLGGLAAIHMLKEARTRYAALITKAQPPVSHDQ